MMILYIKNELYLWPSEDNLTWQCDTIHTASSDFEAMEVKLEVAAGALTWLYFGDYYLILIVFHHHCHLNQIEANEAHRDPGAVVKRFLKHRTLKCWMGLVAHCPPDKDLNFRTKEKVLWRVLENLKNANLGTWKCCQDFRLLGRAAFELCRTREPQTWGWFGFKTAQWYLKLFLKYFKNILPWK